jgi:hypothetical protein
MAPAYKGFNDSMASWSLNRVLSQDCGRTWLRTWAALGANQDGSRPVDAVQLVTWNDYEEGTEVETGIDNCVHLQAWRKGETLNWHAIWTDAKQQDIAANGPSPSEPEDGSSKAGARFADVADAPEATIDHYTVFVSQDGENLMPVADVEAGNESLNLAGLQLEPGHYTAYVKAVAKPGLLNHMSRAIDFTIAPPPAATTADSTATASTAATTVTSAGAPAAPAPPPALVIPVAGIPSSPASPSAVADAPTPAAATAAAETDNNEDVSNKDKDRDADRPHDQ